MSAIAVNDATPAVTARTMQNRVFAPTVTSNATDAAVDAGYVVKLQCSL